MTGPAGAGRTTAIRRARGPRLRGDRQPAAVAAAAAVRRAAARRGRWWSGSTRATASSAVDAAAGAARRDRGAAGRRAGAGLSRLRRRHAGRAATARPGGGIRSSPHETPLVGIEREIALLAPLRARADVLIDTERDDAARAARRDGAASSAREEAGGGLAVTLQSFSYKRGMPRGVDMVIDVRFLRNPHWDAGAARRSTGATRRSRPSSRPIPAYAPFYARLADLLRFLLPAYRAEGKSYFGLGLGCTGGKHRSVALVEALAKTLAAGWVAGVYSASGSGARDRRRAASGLGVGAA